MSDSPTPSEYYGWKYSSTTIGMCKPWPPLPCHNINSKEEKVMGKIKKKARKRHIGGTDIIKLISIRTESLLKIPQTLHFPKNFVLPFILSPKLPWYVDEPGKPGWKSALAFSATYKSYYPHQLGIWRENHDYFESRSLVVLGGPYKIRRIELELAVYKANHPSFYIVFPAPKGSNIWLWFIIWIYSYLRNIF